MAFFSHTTSVFTVVEPREPIRLLADDDSGILPAIGTWDPVPTETERREVDFDRLPVLFLADGRALVRRAGF